MSKPRCKLHAAQHPPPSLCRREELAPWLQFRSGDVERKVFPIHRAVPDTSSKGRYINLLWVFRVRNYSMAPLKIEAGNTLPMFTAVRGSPCGRLKSSSIQNF